MLDTGIWYCQCIIIIIMPMISERITAAKVRYAHVCLFTTFCFSKNTISIICGKMFRIANVPLPLINSEIPQTIAEAAAQAIAGFALPLRLRTKLPTTSKRAMSQNTESATMYNATILWPNSSITLGKRSSIVMIAAASSFLLICSVLMIIPRFPKLCCSCVLTPPAQFPQKCASQWAAFPSCGYTLRWWSRFAPPRGQRPRNCRISRIADVSAQFPRALLLPPFISPSFLP